MISNVDDRSPDPSFMGMCEFVLFSVLVIFMYKNGIPIHFKHKT